MKTKKLSVIERAIVLPAASKLLVKEDDDFQPVKRRKVQENNTSTEVDEVVCSDFVSWGYCT